jgi:hypothetical protein
MTMTKIHVISQRGKLVGTFIPRPRPSVGQPAAKGPHIPYSSPMAGPGQKLHELELENGEAYYKEGRSGELHKIVKKKLKLK